MMHRIWRFPSLLWVIITLLGGMILPAANAAETINGNLAYVSDGDTIVIYKSGTQEKLRVRLAGIDAPEKNQPGGLESKENLSRQLPKGKEIAIESQGQDRYGRMLGVVYADGININQWQLKKGNAWVYRAYNKSQDEIEMEEMAQRNRLGLWGLPSPVPPWKWRKGMGQR